MWSYGLDYGDFQGTSSESFLKDLPLRRVAAGDVLVAFEVNGQPLPTENGFPVRLAVPGFYGTNSVKWLYRMTLADRRADGPFVTTFYNDPVPAAAGDTGGTTRPVWDIAPESVIVRSGPDARLRIGEPLEVFGWAWAAAGVETVAVSVDGGGSWAAAELAPRAGCSWQGFRYVWRPDAAGAVGLLLRATDHEGASQPPDGARNAVYGVDAWSSSTAPWAAAGSWRTRTGPARGNRRPHRRADAGSRAVELRRSLFRRGHGAQLVQQSEIVEARRRALHLLRLTASEPWIDLGRRSAPRHGFRSPRGAGAFCEHVGVHRE